MTVFIIITGKFIVTIGGNCGIITNTERNFYSKYFKNNLEFSEAVLIPAIVSKKNFNCQNGFKKKLSNAPPVKNIK